MNVGHCSPSPLLVLREGKADGFTNKLNERWTLLTLRPCWCCAKEKRMVSPTSLMNVGHCSPFMMTSPLSVLREGKADGFTNKLDERWTLLTLALVGVARRKSGWFRQQA